MVDQNGKLTISDRNFGYWNGDKGRVWDFYRSDEDLRVVVGDLLVNVRELNNRVKELEAFIDDIRYGGK